MIILGLTGSIGMGKTTTANLFRDEGCPVFDADGEVHALYAKGGEAVPLIRAVFPDAIRDGAVDRQKLGDHMRADPVNLQVLESFIHPMVGKRRQIFLDEARETETDIAVMDVPLLLETGGETYVDFVVVVTAPEQIQKDRVMARPGMTQALFDMITSRQIPDAEKREKADFLIYTDKGVENAREQVQSLLTDIRQTIERERQLSA